MNKSCLKLNLKKKWFDMIQSGQKKEEYREIKEYWFRRLLNCYKYDVTSYKISEMVSDMNNPYKHFFDIKSVILFHKLEFKKFDEVLFTNGYHKNARCFSCKIKEIKISTGKTKWGAEEGKFYFTIILNNNKGE